jgi:hypothetical protein
VDTSTRFSALVGFVVVVATALAGCGSGQQPSPQAVTADSKEKRTDKEPKPAEFQVLAKLAGTWGLLTTTFRQ